MESKHVYKSFKKSTTYEEKKIKNHTRARAQIEYF